MNIKWLQLSNFIITGSKRYFRNRSALWFSLFVPVLIMVIFGVLNFGGATKLNVGLVNQSNSPVAAQLDNSFKSIPNFKISEGSKADLMKRIQSSTNPLDMIIVLPSNLNNFNPKSGVPAKVQIYTSASSQTAGAGIEIAGQVVSAFNQSITHAPKPLAIQTSTINTRNLGYIDFLVPGVMAMSVMQSAMFSVAFGFVQLKKRGVLRRLKATPTQPGYFIAGEVASRLIVMVLQALVLVGLGVGFFHLHLIGSLFNLLVVVIFGALVFLALGFAIAGWAKDENQAAPLANLITLPMLFLSGVFFSRDAMPKFLQTITGYLPLTYFADGLRHIANDGSSLWSLRGDLLGLLVWGVICFIIAISVFRWE
jgi:ABC-2 type transport system permease protein